ncbi:MAG: LysM peptidoglycan-binding domain-containing protein [Thermodesulfovibrionia bacterium]|nr:LysM peptidoglycan-binding domain-containing protein [Thermodesulfovibrionia bacterium]
MKIRALLLVIVFGLIINYASADDTESKNYIIIKGDTLWDISNNELKEPMLWPKLWHANPQIANPDLIYPGSKIWIPEELMRLTKDTQNTGDKTATDELELDFPEFKPVIAESSKPEIEYIVDKNTYVSTGWVSNEYQSLGEVFFTNRGRNLFGKTETVFLKIGNEVSVGDMFLSIRKMKEIKHPKTGSKLGYQVKVTGLLEVVGIENNTTKAIIIEEYDHVDDGDNLMAYIGCPPPARLMTARTPDIHGYIVGSKLDNHISYKGDIVYLDKGSEDGLEPGDVFSIQDNAPMGTLQVISTRSNTAAAIILDIQQEVMTGDTWGKK